MIKEIKKLVGQIVIASLMYFASIGFTKADNLTVEQETVEMADTFREEGKIYVLTGIILIILFGFFGYAFSIERKINRIEKSIETKS